MCFYVPLSFAKSTKINYILLILHKFILQVLKLCPGLYYKVDSRQRTNSCKYVCTYTCLILVTK